MWSPSPRSPILSKIAAISLVGKIRDYCQYFSKYKWPTHHIGRIIIGRTSRPCWRNDVWVECLVLMGSGYPIDPVRLCWGERKLWGLVHWLCWSNRRCKTIVDLCGGIGKPLERFSFYPRLRKRRKLKYAIQYSWPCNVLHALILNIAYTKTHITTYVKFITFL